MKVFVHRYKWGHAKRRKQLRRACRDKKAKVVQETKEGWLYEVDPSTRIKR